MTRLLNLYDKTFEPLRQDFLDLYDKIFEPLRQDFLDLYVKTFEPLRQNFWPPPCINADNRFDFHLVKPRGKNESYYKFFIYFFR